MAHSRSHSPSDPGDQLQPIRRTPPATSGFPACASILLAAIFLVFSAIPADAGNAALRVPCNNLPPWKLATDNGTCTGIDVELTGAVAERMGFEVEYIPCPFKRCLKLMEQGRADLMTGVLLRPERENYLLFIDPPYKDNTDKAFYTLRGREQTVSTYTDLHHLRIGTTSGTGYHPKFDDDPKITKDMAHKTECSFLKLAKDRIDAVIITESAGDYIIRKMGLLDTIGKAPFGFRKHQNVYMVLSRTSPFMARADEFSRVLRDLARENALEGMKLKFMNGIHPAD